MYNPIELLKIEYLKFKNNSVMVLLSIVFLIAMPSIIFIGKKFDNLPSEIGSNKIFYKFPTVWDFEGYIGNWLVYALLTTIIIFSITNEVTYKTMRQNIITGYQRRTYFLSKFYTIIFLASFAALYYMLICLVIGMTNTAKFNLTTMFDNDYATLRFFLMSVGYMIMAALISFFFRRPILSLLIFGIYTLFIEHLLKWALHFQYIDKGYSVNFYPTNVFEDLMPFYGFHFTNLIPRDNLNFDFLLDEYHAIWASLVYIALFSYLSYRMVMNKDL